MGEIFCQLKVTNSQALLHVQRLERCQLTQDVVSSKSSRNYVGDSFSVNGGGVLKTCIGDGNTGDCKTRSTAHDSKKPAFKKRFAHSLGADM